MTLTRSQVLAELRYWRRVLGIGAEWKFNVRVLDEDDPAAPENVRESQAYIRVHSGYSAADLVVHAHRITDEADLRAVIAHEVVHVVLDAPASIVRQALADRFVGHAEDIIEASVERVTRAMLRLDGQVRAKRKK